MSAVHVVQIEELFTRPGQVEVEETDIVEHSEDARDGEVQSALQDGQVEVQFVQLSHEHAGQQAVQVRHDYDGPQQKLKISQSRIFELL